MTIKIRHEIESDHYRVEVVTREAFWNQYAPGCDEHFLVHELRKHKDFIQEFDFVVEVDGVVIGNIMYTRSHVENKAGDKIETVTFGPVSILPEFQKKGIGSKLISHTLNLVKDMDYPAVIIFGDPHNYCKHDFKNGADYNVGTMGGNFPYGFLVLELKEGIFKDHKWEYIPSEAYNFDRAKVEEFDKLFDPKVKEWKPSQEVFSIQRRASLN